MEGNIIMDRDLKRSIILDNYQSPNNKHTSDDSYFKINTRNVSCIDNLDIYLKIEDNIIKDISFEGEACVISISSTNILTNLLVGKTKEEKLQTAICVYNKIKSWYDEFVSSEQGKNCIEEFDKVMPKYAWFSPIKKIDFFLWSMR